MFFKVLPGKILNLQVRTILCAGFPIPLSFVPILSCFYVSSGSDAIIGVLDVQTRWGQQHGADVNVRHLMAVVMSNF